MGRFGNRRFAALSAAVAVAVALLVPLACAGAALGENASASEVSTGAERTATVNTTADAEPTAPVASEAEILSAFTLKLNEAFEAFQTMGAAVCIIQNGAVTDMFTYGALGRKGEPVTANTLFRVGSISKMVTAMGVMQLTEAGKISLDGDLSAALGFSVRNPAYPETSITLRQLLTHTAGLRDSNAYRNALNGKVTPLDELFSAKRAGYQFLSNFEAGTKTEYSNFGGGLLGSVLEAVTGQTVDAYMQERVFAPLRITAAYQSALLPADAAVSDMYRMPSGRVAASVRDGQPANRTADALTDYTLTAGKLTLSAPDLAKLVIVLCEGGRYGDTRILSEDTVAQMLTLQNGIGSVQCDSGRGLGLNLVSDEGLNGRVLYGHGGKANGMLCAAYFDPTDGSGFVMLTNGCNNRAAESNVGKLTLTVMRLVYGELIEPRRLASKVWLVGD